MRVSQYRQPRSTKHRSSRATNGAPANEPCSRGLDLAAIPVTSASARNNVVTQQSASRQKFKFPLLGKVFYLDIPESDAAEMVNDVQRLGGRIEDSFNPKKITHVVTNRVLDGEQQSHAEQARLKYSSSRLKRVELMLSRNKQMRSFKGEDILSVAKKMRKKIVQLETMKRYLTKHLPESDSPVPKQAFAMPQAGAQEYPAHDYMDPTPLPAPVQQPAAPPVDGDANLPPLQSPVKPSFGVAYDPRFHFHPHVFHPMQASPMQASPMQGMQGMQGMQEMHGMQGIHGMQEMHGMHGMQGFAQPMRPIAPVASFARLDDADNMFKPMVKVFDPSPSGTSTIPEVNFSVPPPYTPFHSQSDCQRLLDVLAARERNKEKKGDDMATQKRPTRVVPKRGGFCECCRARYDNYVEHVGTDGHRAFEADERNYMVLDELIREGK